MKLQNIQILMKFLMEELKTLHPRIHAGILADKNNINHKKQLNDLNFDLIDLVIVNLYPFEDSIKKLKENECIENIDIGGPH